MNRAATELHTVQSNVTARVRALETQLGCSLFDRHSRGVALTGAGTRLLPYARRLAWLLADAARAARDDGEPRGPLTIGALETTAALLPVRCWIAAYARACPEVDLALRPGTTAELIEAVLDRRLEGAFVCGPVAHQSLIEQTMFEEELYRVVALLGLTSLEQATQGGIARIVVLRAGCSYRQRLEMLLARRGIAVPRLLEFGTLEAIFGCVSAGLGITVTAGADWAGIWHGRATSQLAPVAGGVEAIVSTVFIHRREAAFCREMRARCEGVSGACPEGEAIVADDTADLIKPLAPAEAVAVKLTLSGRSYVLAIG